MIECKYDPMLPYRCVEYGRMSDESQNPRSPDQQFIEIDREIQRRGYPWTILKRYRDDGISGRYFDKRPGLRTLLNDIRLGIVAPDLLLIDHRERLGRAEELADVRRELSSQHGVLIVTADKGFEDPTTCSGQIVTAFEEVRARDNNRLKARDVLRGKKDAVRQKMWPGGKAPIGFRLESIFGEVNGLREKVGSRLVHDDQTACPVRLIFERADATGEGQIRLARFANAHPDIPDCLKPIASCTIGYMLDHELYYGAFHFPKHCTDVLNEVNVREHNDIEEILVIEDFCEPIVSRALWERVQAVRRDRREKLREQRKQPGNNKLIRPLGTGISVKHLLSGLARCGHCGAAMRPVGASLTKDPSGKYIYFQCPRSIEGTCHNKQTVPVKWLTSEVIAHIRRTLLGEES